MNQNQPTQSDYGECPVCHGTGSKLRLNGITRGHSVWSVSEKVILTR